MTLTPSVSDLESIPVDDVDSIGNSKNSSINEMLCHYDYNTWFLLLFLGQYTESQIDEETAYEEDNYRKVLRSLEHGDSVLDIYNISRITGLDACGNY